MDHLWILVVGLVAYTPTRGDQGEVRATPHGYRVTGEEIYPSLGLSMERVSEILNSNQQAFMHFHVELPDFGNLMNSLKCQGLRHNHYTMLES